MNAVEYCLLHGLKLAGPEHPAILCAQESLSYGALAARFRRRLARGGRSSLWSRGHADAWHARPHRPPSRRGSGWRNHTDPRVTEEHYNRATSIGASRIYAEII